VLSLFYASVVYFSESAKILEESRRWQAMYENLTERIMPFQVMIVRPICYFSYWNMSCLNLTRF